MKISSTLLATLAKSTLCIAALCAAPASFAGPIALTNEGFEEPSQGQGFSYLVGQTVGGWTFGGGSGIAANNSAFNVSQAPGNQAGFLQGQGSTISQTFNFTGGLFFVDFLAEFRNGYGGNTINVLIDNQKLTFGGADAFAPSTGLTFSSYKSDALSLAAGQHVLTFAGTSPQDYTTFIDNVSVSAVPEPGTLALFAIGVLGAGALRRRRKS